MEQDVRTEQGALTAPEEDFCPVDALKIRRTSMKYIKLFIASSVVEFAQERLALSDFIRTLNDIYICQDTVNWKKKSRMSI